MSYRRILLNARASSLAKSKFNLFSSNFLVNTKSIQFRLLNAHKDPQIFLDSAERELKLLEEDEKFRSLLEHFKNGTPWEKTSLYSLMLDKISSAGGEYKGLRNHLEIINYYKQMDSYFENVKQKGLRIPKNENFIDLCMGRFAMNGVTIEIMNNGEPVFAGRGTHRLAMSIAAEKRWTPVFLVGISRSSLVTKTWKRHLKLD